MKITALRRIANWIDFGVSLLAAVFIATVLVIFAEIDLKNQPMVVQSQRLSLILGGATLAVVLLIGAILRAVQHVSLSGQRRYLVFETPGGSVSVRIGSVEHAINRAAAHMEEVADASVSLVLPKGENIPTEARVRCRLFDRPNILAIQDKVRATVSDRYLDMFPGQDPLPVQVSVERIVFEVPGPKAPPPPVVAAPSGDDEDDQEPIRPQYPVGD